MTNGNNWVSELRRNMRQTTIYHRDWRVVRRLAAVTSVLLAASLPAEFQLGSSWLMWTCYSGAAVAGAAMLRYYYDKRVFIRHSPR